MALQEEADWTVDQETGCSNASPRFVQVRDHIARLLKTELYMLQDGEKYGTSVDDRIAIVAQLITAHLAHDQHMVPSDLEASRPE